MATRKPNPKRYNEQLTIALPSPLNRDDVLPYLEQVALNAGYISTRRKEPHGSVGQMLAALASGKAMIINLAPKEETPPDK
jgi:hypothetical protein